MFKRKPTYLMQIDAQIKFPFENIRQMTPALAARSDDELRPLLLESLERQVMEVAREELANHGQHPTKRIEGGGHVRKTGTEFMSNPVGEHYGIFSIAFNGGQDGAVAAAEAWCARVATFGGIEEIGHASLRGTDGTNLHIFDEKIEAAVANMDPELLAQIDELMDPERTPD